MATLVMGVDAGATTTRCVIATVDGHVRGRGTAGGANRNSSGGEVTATLGVALAEALATVDPASVRLGVLGAAGSAGAGREAFRAAALRAWRDAGLTGEVVTATDLEVAYAAGTPAADGVLLLAGTGALAARFAGGELRRRCDGYGWLLGDEGSAVWIAVRALRAVLAALDGRGEWTTLVEEACAHFDMDIARHEAAGGAGREKAGGAGREEADAARHEETAQALLAAGFAVPPAALGRFAPAVSAAADGGDPVAGRICAAAAARLLHTYDSVEPPPGAAVVLAGSVLLTPGPVGRAVRAGLRARTAGEPRPALDGAGGAAALALGRLTGAPVPPVVHARLTSSIHEPARGASGPAPDGTEPEEPGRGYSR
ncbi:N-acetylglucosamine kinase [Paractinoplanes deccanensis]|uniref:N-acetylglucosamine kinase n=1 Tax=Paractinoplanes deccanensis TaxID=113561 RepID=A0ABQ3XWU0_9ACTN|nr:BadF/BadG/BcrA/BcrD ATPase family protein [Actinoplanes deccanensis]GID72211.1 N-acetylglucosamine kinase [Actinoplanes deccanensis]